MNPKVKEFEIEKLLQEAHAIRINNLSKSIEIAEIALAISTEIDNKSFIGKSLNQLALYHMVKGEMDKATDYSKQSITIFTNLKDEIGLADAKYSLAGVYYKTNQYHLGLINFSDALEIYQKNNDYYNQSRTQKSLGTIYEFIGDTTSAFNVYKKAIRNAKKINDYNLESNVYNNLSGILIKSKKFHFAMKFIDKSIQLKKQTSDIRGMAYALYGKAKVYHSLNESTKAEDYYYQALEIHNKMGENTGIAMTLTKLAQFYYNCNDLEKALIHGLKGLELSESLQLSMSTIKLNKIISLIYKDLKDYEKSLFYLENHLKEKEAVINTQTLKVIESYELITKMKSLEKETELQTERQKLFEKKNQDEMEIYRQKQEFLSIMSHEIRTPLNAIIASITLLDNQATNEERKIINSLRFASNNLINIVNDVLDFNKLDTNNSKLEKTPTNLNYLCENVIGIFHRLAKEKDISLEYITNINLSNNYLIDQTKFTQILNNLISNAIKFTENGKVTLELKEVTSSSSKDSILIKVSDTGEGISQGDMIEIFNCFSQLKPYLTRKQGGTGLGLSIVKKIIELHDTEIFVESELGIGSHFYFQVELEKTVQKKIEKINQNELIGKAVLIVDDTRMNAILLEKLLDKWKMQVDYVESGVDAIEIVSNKKFDFILMDIHMPEMNGFEASRIIKESENLNNQTPILALTADILADSDESFSKYFSGIIYKPFEIEKLYDLFSRFILPFEIKQN